MQRRKFIAAMGSLAAGGAAATGTGAFTSVQAERTVSVNVADDSNAFLRLNPTSGANSAYASDNGDGEVTINLNSDAGVNGQGINSDARTILFDVFQVENQGTQPAVVYTPAESVTIGGNKEINNLNSGDYIDPQINNRPYGDYSNSSQKTDEVSATALYNEYYQSNTTTFEGAVSNIYGTANNNSGLDEFKLTPGDSFSFGLWLEEDGDGSFDNVSLDIKADTTLL